MIPRATRETGLARSLQSWVAKGAGGSRLRNRQHHPHVGFKVFLWSFHDTFDVHPLLKSHPQFHFRDAREHLSIDKFLDMLRAEWPWGNISDIIRFRSAREQNLETGAWVLDLDTWWLRRPTAENSPSSTGHVIATCAARNRRVDGKKHWKYMYLSRPGVRPCVPPPNVFPSQ